LNAAHAAQPPAILRGSVALEDKVMAPSNGGKEALYLTAKETRTPVEIAGSAVKPAVLSARFQGPLSFPYSFELTENDLTAEGKARLSTFSSSEVVLSARYDVDGVAATRDPSDLVGKSTVKPDKSGFSDVNIQLTDRGAGGRFVTKKR
jgi:hypothetical protein